MTRKNPTNKPLRISLSPHAGGNYALVLSHLAIAESNLVLAGKDSAMPHFIAIVKELERLYEFKFEQIPDDAQQT